jgi:phosphoribosylformylglycinamidine synthase
MWSPKKSQNEGYNLLSAVESLSSVMCNLGIAIDGGKDSLSMHTDIDNTTYYSLPTLVLTGYSTVPDINLSVTPLLTNDNDSILVYIPMNNIFDSKNNFR